MTTYSLLYNCTLVIICYTVLYITNTVRIDLLCYVLSLEEPSVIDNRYFSNLSSIPSL